MPLGYYHLYLLYFLPGFRFQLVLGQHFIGFRGQSQVGFLLGLVGGHVWG